MVEKTGLVHWVTTFKKREETSKSIIRKREEMKEHAGANNL